MPLDAGTRIGPFEVVGQLGAGGMGEVYRARDTKLDREVALKILPPEFARDAERVARFRREAKTLAAINHPHIAQIHGLEESADGTLALVMELVEGEDLAVRLKRGAIPVDEALPVARQIAEALEAAHEQGIIHRDLKPANIKVRPDGTVKVLDFGLAKAIDQNLNTTHLRQGSGGQATPQHLSNSPTITSPAMTMHGVILGTAVYMAPEQAKGKPVDRRADIWAFGCVLYEMLTGARAFDGEDTTEILGAIVKTDPDWTKLPPATPSVIVALLRRCLQKEPRKRQQHIGDARIEIDEAIATPAHLAAAPSVANRAAHGYVPWSIIAVLIAALTTALVMGWPREVPATFQMHVDLTTPSISSPHQLVDFALSPDGRHLAYFAGGQAPSLSVRSIETGETRELSGTDGAQAPFWSPDGRSIGFVRGTKLMRLDLNATSPVSIADVTLLLGSVWLPDNTILYSPGIGQPLMRVPASGGAAIAMTSLEADEYAHGHPRLLPDGEHYLYIASRITPEEGLTVELHMGSLRSAETRRVRSQLSAAAANFDLLLPNWVVYWFDGQLRAQRLDIQGAALVGEPVRVADGVVNSPDRFMAAFSTSDNGLIAYRTGGFSKRLAWFDRTGRVLGLAGEGDAAAVAAATVSPDGARIALDRTASGNRDLWLLDVDRQTMSRLTSYAGEDGTPVWSPDGTRLAYESQRPFNLYVRPAAGDGQEERLQESVMNQWPLDWSADGRFLLYLQTANYTDGDLYALPMSGTDRTPVPVATTSFVEMSGSFSPDGRWVAYQTDASGRPEIVAQAFPNPMGTVPLSVAGGRTPHWSPDGREVFFIAPDGRMMSVPVTLAPNALKAGAPAALFQTALGYDSGILQFDVDRRGRFLMDMGGQPAPPIRLLLNWKPPAP